jgi:tRNA (guanine26-N2/guanine27-N2)-dimethyltransferase
MEYDGMKKCDLCGGSMSVGGQLWTGTLHDRDFVGRMLLQNPDRQCKKLLDAAAEERSGIPYYFRADEISARMKTSPHSVQRIIEKLGAAGFAASRASLNPGAFKTDARLDQILQALK